jgi:hypothetical protein
MAMGSANQLEYHPIPSRDLRFPERDLHVRAQGRRLFGGSIRKIDAERRSPDPAEPLNRQNEKPGWLARLFSTE